MKHTGEELMKGKWKGDVKDAWLQGHKPSFCLEVPSRLRALILLRVVWKWRHQNVWAVVAWIASGLREKHAGGITHYQNSLEESENPIWRRRRTCCVPPSLLHEHLTETWPKVWTLPFANRPGSEHAAHRRTRRTPRTRTRTHITQRVSFWRFLRPSIPEVQRISHPVSHVLATTVLCKLTSCSNLGAFFDSKHCWFILASRAREILTNFLSYTHRNSFTSKTSCKIIFIMILTRLKKLVENWK